MPSLFYNLQILSASLGVTSQNITFTSRGKQMVWSTYGFQASEGNIGRSCLACGTQNAPAHHCNIIKSPPQAKIVQQLITPAA